MCNLKGGGLELSPYTRVEIPYAFVRPGLLEKFQSSKVEVGGLTIQSGAYHSKWNFYQWAMIAQQQGSKFTSEEISF